MQLGEEMSESIHVGHPDPNIAYHFEWGFRNEALLWEDGLPVGVNFYPLATELYQWLLRKGQFTVLSKKDKDEKRALTNPYTYNASVLAAIFANCLNAGYAFSNETEEIDDMDAEIERIRIYNEQVLYTARFCEAAIKQLLFCTQIPKRYYKRAALGALLSQECKECKAADQPHHKISLLGSLAHRYRLCIAFEHCLAEHLKIVNRRRNIEAAHSDTQELRIRTVAESRAHLERDSVESANEFVHMLSHISDLEKRMMEELRSNVIAAHFERA